MATALEYFRQLAPEFAAVSDDVVTAWIATAQVFNAAATAHLDTEQKNAADALYAAHLMWIQVYQKGGSVKGAVIKEKVDVIEVQYADPNSTGGATDWYTQSPYGGLYLQLTGASFGGNIMTRFGDGPFPGLC